MMVELAALVWMELLYGVDVDSLTYTDQGGQTECALKY